MRSPEHDEILPGGNMAGEVRRIGETVRRLTGPWTPGVHHLLRHLEQVGFHGAPRALGIDEQAREILSFIPGEVVHPRVLDDTDLARVACLIGEFHTAAASFVQPADARWQTIGRDPSGVDELICHNDLAPWNLIVGDQDWAFIDWDLAAPGRRLWDLALPACTFVPLWPEQPADMRRYHMFCEAYGLSSVDEHELLNVVVERTQRMWQTLVDNVDREPYATLVLEGHANGWRSVAEYVKQQKTLWRGQLSPLQ
ncbi:MAG: phosphotransferase [Chloroflexota bacterium]|nr:phosphotransferase [Chloroflexota bacterium]